MEKYLKKISFNSDVLYIDSIRYTAESLHMLPEDLDPQQFWNAVMVGTWLWEESTALITAE